MLPSVTEYFITNGKHSAECRRCGKTIPAPYSEIAAHYENACIIPKHY